MPKPASYTGEHEAIQELLHIDAGYSGGSACTTVRPYVRDLVSLPDVGTVGTKLVPIAEVMDPVGREVVEDALNRMLVDEETWGGIAERHSRFRPYMDRVLANDPKQYQQFVLDLWSKNMCSRFHSSAPFHLAALWSYGNEQVELNNTSHSNTLQFDFFSPPSPF